MNPIPELLVLLKKAILCIIMLFLYPELQYAVCEKRSEE